MRTVTFVIHNSFSLSDKEMMEELLLAETRMNDGSRLRFHLHECPTKVEDLQNKIDAYKFICQSANVPKFIIDHPETVKPEPLTEEDKKWAKETIAENKRK